MLIFKYLSRGILQRFRRIGQDTKGIALLETVMAITIFAALGTALMVGIRTANISTEVVEDQSIAEKLARNQMEYVFNQSYLNPPSSYVSIKDATDVSFTVDPGFTVTANATEYLAAATDIEKVVVTVVVAVYSGSETVLTLETLRTKVP